jgi:hypothetical protein
VDHRSPPSLFTSAKNATAPMQSCASAMRPATMINPAGLMAGEHQDKQ